MQAVIIMIFSKHDEIFKAHNNFEFNMNQEIQDKRQKSNKTKSSILLYHDFQPAPGSFRESLFPLLRPSHTGPTDLSRTDRSKILRICFDLKVVLPWFFFLPLTAFATTETMARLHQSISVFITLLTIVYETSVRKKVNNIYVMYRSWQGFIYQRSFSCTVDNQARKYLHFSLLFLCHLAEHHLIY